MFPAPGILVTLLAGFLKLSHPLPVRCRDVHVICTSLCRGKGKGTEPCTRVGGWGTRYLKADVCRRIEQATVLLHGAASRCCRLLCLLQRPASLCVHPKVGSLSPVPAECATGWGPGKRTRGSFTVYSNVSAGIPFFSPWIFKNHPIFLAFQ